MKTKTTQLQNLKTKPTNTNRLCASMAAASLAAVLVTAPASRADTIYVTATSPR